MVESSLGAGQAQPSSEADRILTDVRVVVDRLENLEPDALEVTDASIRSEQLPVLHAASSFGLVATAIFIDALGLGAFARAWLLGAGLFLHWAGAQPLPPPEVDIFLADNKTWVQVPGRPQPCSPQDAPNGVDLTSKDRAESSAGRSWREHFVDGDPVFSRN